MSDLKTPFPFTGHDTLKYYILSMTGKQLLRVIEYLKRTKSDNLHHTLLDLATNAALLLALKNHMTISDTRYLHRLIANRRPCKMVDWWNSLPDHVHYSVSQTRISKAHIAVSTTANLQLPNSSSWSCLCLDHGASIGAESMAAAQKLRINSGEWCVKCLKES